MATRTERVNLSYKAILSRLGIDNPTKFPLIISGGFISGQDQITSGNFSLNEDSLYADGAKKDIPSSTTSKADLPETKHVSVFDDDLFHCVSLQLVS